MKMMKIMDPKNEVSYANSSANLPTMQCMHQLQLKYTRTQLIAMGNDDSGKDFQAIWLLRVQYARRIDK